MYDLVFCGGGMAARSLVCRILDSPLLQKKKILIIDRDFNSPESKTWAFWETDKSYFENIISSRWDKIRIVSPSGELLTKDISPYSYKVISGSDFNEYTLSKLRKSNNVHFKSDTVVKISRHKVFLQSGETVKASYIFDSLPPLIDTKELTYYQQFLGFTITTQESFFDTSTAEIMNFDVEQAQKECRFVYILPISKTQALIEYTLFTPNIYPWEQMEAKLTNFLSVKVGNYTIHRQEKGIIPMSTQSFVSNYKSGHIYIGSAGGFTQAHTGYTFANTQKKVSEIIQFLEDQNYKPQTSSNIATSINHAFLRALTKKNFNASSYLFSLFHKNSAGSVLAFLENNASLNDRLKIMFHSPWHLFIPAFLASFFKTLTKK